MAHPLLVRPASSERATILIGRLGWGQTSTQKPQPTQPGSHDHGPADHNILQEAPAFH
jgi:hypothetical protein